jgi:hypothetical protein
MGWVVNSALCKGDRKWTISDIERDRAQNRKTGRTGLRPQVRKEVDFTAFSAARLLAPPTANARKRHSITPLALAEMYLLHSIVQPLHFLERFNLLGQERWIPMKSL